LRLSFEGISHAAYSRKSPAPAGVGPRSRSRAHARGVDVRLVADRRAPCDLQEGVSALAAAGIPNWIDTRARVAHEKALAIAAAELAKYRRK
jgi:hypothetical protein